MRYLSVYPLRGVAMRYVYDDGGRKAAGFKGKARDCVARAIAIATQTEYRTVYDALTAHCGGGVDRGIPKSLTRSYLCDVLGWRWVPCMGIGTGCTVHVRDGELPSGRLIVSLSRHVVAVVDGVIYDTHDPSKGGKRCVYGYYVKSGG